MSDLIQISRRSFLTGSAAMGAIIMLHPFSARAASQPGASPDHGDDGHPCERAALRLLCRQAERHDGPVAHGLADRRGIRKEATNSMLIDNGDLLQGNPMGDYIAYEKGMKDGDLHPIMKGMNLLGYECSTLGNHEFNYGLSFLDKVLAGANFPFVCANLIRGTELAANPRDDKLYLKPYRHPRQEDQGRRRRRAADQDRHHRLRAAADHDLGRQEPRRQRQTRDIVEAAKAWVPQMKEEGADIVIALSHSGIDVKQGDMMENASFFVAGVDGIDAVFTGHQHLVFPGKKDFQELEGVDTDKGHAGRASRPSWAASGARIWG